MIKFGALRRALHICICFMATFVYAPLHSKPNDVLDLVVVLATGCEEVLKVDHVTHEPCCNELFAACKDEQVIVVSPSIIYGLLKRQRTGQDIISECLDRITRNYSIFLCQEEDFVVLVPNTKSKGLKDLGFQESHLTRIEPDRLMQFSAQKWACHLIEIEHFRNLFRQQDIGYEPTAKHIYLISHGIDALDEIKDFKWSMPLVASLTVWQFVNFLQMLNAINTKFLHIASCYAAGCNFFNINRILSGSVDDERCINANVPIQFPIMVQGTTDSVVSAIIGDGPSVKIFFSIIRQWLENNKDGDLLAELLSRSVYGLKNVVAAPNYPLLRLPDSQTAISVPVQGVQVINHQCSRIPVSSDLHHLLFYPCVLSSTKIVFESFEPCVQCVSKIFGKAGHFLGEMQVPQIDEQTLVNWLEGCFLKEIIRNYEGASSFGVSDKAWFINRLVSDERNESTIAKGIVIQKGMLKYGQHKVLILYQSAKGTFHRMTASLPIVRAFLQDEVVTENEYAQAVYRVFWETKADPESLSCATDGKETEDSLSLALADFFHSLDLSVPSIDPRVFIQEDLARVRIRSIKKETYLNYVAHIHDTQVLHELIEVCKHKNECIYFTDLATVMNRFVDMEYHQVSLNGATRLLSIDDIAAKRAGISVIDYLVSVGLYVHASRASESVLACIESIAHKQNLEGTEVALVQEIRNFFAHLLTEMIKVGQIQAADFIMAMLINHEKWYVYGLGLEICNQLMKQELWKISSSTQPRLQWFMQQIEQQRTQVALAVYFEQMQVIEEYHRLASC